ncbi:cadherin-like domain-containing protein, partial [Thalassospira sp.]|uniref:cadherin-like domain-containing protein n=1 Tax=Thalassospira sp. TaxID=1912094 RepID=UPI002580B54A
MTQLSEQQINSLRTLADTGDIGGVYKQMSEFGVGYGELALDVYSGQGFGGIYANNLLTLGDSLNLSLMSDVEFDAFRKKLAEAAIDTVESFGTYLPAAEIDRFHEEIFAKYQLPWFSYGGANYGDLFGQEALENYYNTGEITFDLPDELDWGLIADLYEGQYVNFPIAIGSLSEWGFIEFGDWWESEFGDGFWDWSSGARDGFWPGSNSPDAEVIIGPIGIEGYGEPVILDLDGDGIELVNIEDSQAFYDLDGDGFKENVGWTSSDDAILAIDVDGDGEIEKAEEVNFTLHHEDAETDLDGVRLAFDSNQDGILDSNDDRFSDFRVWQDLDGDGTADEGELKTLAEAGIKSIGLEAERNDQNIDGNILHRTTELTFDDGSHSTVGDVSFKLSDFGLRNEDNGSTTIKIDENSQILLGTSTDDVLTAPEQNTILMGGTGNDTLQGGRGDDWLFGGEGGDDLLGGEGDDIFYADGQDTISGGDGFDTILFSGTEGVEFDLTSHGIEAAIGSDGNDKLISSAGASAILSGGNGADLLAGSWNGDLLTGGSGNDTLKGNAGDDTYVFGRGDGLDTIEDRWDGAAAFDYLQELYGDDSFDGHFFALRYHEDLMQTNAGNDTLILGEGIAPEDLLFRVQGTDLVIALKNADGTVSEFANTTDRLTIKDWDSEASQIENIEFSNGTSLNLKNFLNDLGLQTDGTVLNTEQAISAKLQEIEKNIELERALWSGSSDRDIVIADPVASFIETGSGEDILFGSAESDLLLAGDDSDLIFAGGGHDWIDAGHGIDFVDAGDGDDTIIGRGDGDVIDGGAGSDLLDYGQSDDGVRLDMSDTKGYEADHIEDRAQDIEAVTGSGFNDDLAGSALNETFEAGAGDDTVSGRLGDDELSGGAGDDTLLGQQGDDVLHGGSGDDILSGGSGDDTLYGGEGNNLLFGGEGDDEAVFAGSRDDYDFVRDGDDLIVIGAEGETRLSDIETIRFDDEVFNVEELLADEDIPVTTENRQRRDEQYQTALAASVASAVALGGLASTYDNTAQAAERIEASADTGDGDTADVWIVEPVSSGDAKDPFVAGASDGDLLTGSGSESDENLNIAQLGVDMSGETGASNSHSVIAGETVSDSGNEIETMPEMIGTIVSDPSEELPVPENAAENPDDAEEAQATANDDASEIIPPNLAPIVTADFAHTLEDQEIRVKIADLLANDFDPERMRLEFVSLGSVSGGSVRIDGGYLVFSPDPDFHGDALISYSLRDSHNNIVPSRLTIAVTEVNDIPVVTGERVSGNEDTVLRLSIAELLANDSDMDGDSLSLSSLVGVEHGTAEIDGDDILFTPDANHNGEAVLRYAVSDGRGGQTIGTVRIDIAAVNDTPEPVDDIAATNEDQAIELLIADLLSNDEDIEGDSLSLSAITSVTGGTAVISGGKVIFRPDADFHGEASFTYRVEDGQGGVSEATTRIAVAEVNDIPLVTGERVSGREDTVLRLSIADLLVNDSDADGDSLNLSSLVGVEHGTAEIDGNDILFTPDANHNGEAVLRYAVSDGRGGQTVGTVRIDVAAVNDAPVAGDDTRSSLEDNTLSIRFAELLSNDSDVDGDTLSITGIVSTQYGNAVIENDQILFTPDEDFNGTASVVYRLSDGNGGISTGVVSINVLAVNDASVAVDDWFSTNEDRSISISSESLLSNDYDSDDDTPAVTGVSDPVGGSVTLDNGNITFLPSANFNGNASFKYQIDDGNGGTAEATVTVQVIAVNDAPDLVDDTA